MKYFRFSIPVVFLLHIALILHGQYRDLPEADTETMPDDTAKVNLLIRLGERYCSVDNQKALVYLQEALYLANKLDYEWGIAHSYLWQGRVYYYMDDYELARRNLENSRKLLEELNDYGGLAFYHFACGSISNLKGDCLNALRSFQNVVSYSKRSHNQLMYSAGLFCIGAIHNFREEHQEALEYMNQAVKIKKSINDVKGLGNAYTAMGKTHELQHQYDSAMYYYLKGLEIREASKDIRTISNSLVVIGKLQIKLGKYQDAKENLLQAHEYYTRLEEQTGILIVDTWLALAMDHLGDENAAQQKIDYALSETRRLKNPALECDCYKVMAKMAAHNGDYKKAYEITKKLKTLNDSLDMVNREDVIQEMEARFSLSRKNDQIKLLETHNSVQKKNIIILSISIAALVLIILLLVVVFRMKAISHQRQRKLFEQEKTIREQAEKISEKEMQLLQEQVESKNRELASKALEVLRINETISSIIQRLEEINSHGSEKSEYSASIREIAGELENHSRKNTWKEFDKIFKNIHNDFYENLLKEAPGLTASEIKVAALLRLNLSTKEIASISFKTEEGVKSARYRLRKKIGLSAEDNLVPFLMKL